MKVTITGNTLTLDDVARVAIDGWKTILSNEAISNIQRSEQVVKELVESKEVVYGVTTGFGKFSDTVISAKDSKALQRNLIVTHAVGAGECFSEEVARAIMLLRLNNIARGFSGVRITTVNTLMEMINKGVTPLIPQKGSLGASGDLAPLAHMVLPMIGLGYATYRGETLSGSKAMELAGIKPIELEAKEGLALINGTQVMTAVGALTLYEGLKLMELANIAAALSLEVHRGVKDAFDPRIQDLRPHKGQIETAKTIRELLDGSKNITKQGEIRMQDAYCLRCVPQVHGAIYDVLDFVKQKIDIEINSVTDNPIIFSTTKEGISGGNFHGEIMALSFDFLGMGLSELANISERRIERLVNPSLSGLPAFLAINGGLNSGFMIVQYAAAALVSENKVLSHPASVDSIPSSANQEDHVSMGTISARKANEILKNSRRVISMEFMCAAQAIDLMSGKEGLSKATKAAYNLIRTHINTLNEDRPLYEDINTAEQLLDEILKVVNNEING